ncbi:hypothetical protein DAPPUDRAFT_329904 [Daphnia pulex]|uniref:Uncharacterized protein n=1 Tax=Daphnia pulex TaxID=6669 RepID=E9HHY8_DAPPU|nr:hypothetical protein DAPPUDRAFT_329904 [Daphnia pulex]|eukprot:EFX68632.1 hypothetical protein DAPPUDRAFT_329904 [Daphnia pulex]
MVTNLLFNYREIIELFLLDKHQNPAKANVDVENEEPQTENVELNKEKEVVGVHVSHTGSEGTQQTSSTVTVTLTQSEDGTYFPPPHLIDQLDAWELGVSPSLTINTLAPPSSGQLLLEIATGALNVAASELPVPVNGTKYRVQQQLQLSSIQHRRHLVKPVELTTMTASNPSSFLPVTLSETQVLISSTSPPVSVVTIRSETPELPTPETGQ